MKKISILLVLLLALACGKKEHDLIVMGTVKGLKKGTIYLQRVSDTALIAMDSVSVLGDSSFELHSELSTPEMYYLYLDKNDNSENRLPFFADKGITEVNTTLKNFVSDAKINGSKQQEVLMEYNRMIKQFNDKSLDLIKANFEAQKAQNKTLADSLQDVMNRYDNSRFKYALNFTMNHLDSEVTPYIVLSDMYNANIKALDTIYNNLDEKVLNSKYGVDLKKFIEDVKLKETTE
jgi:succinate dehydrogenase flavin-adding protein (antitoxin of CptAB toxin-antitoxin module)